ncbi:MAG: hypothetical protein IJ329_01880 [Clostridia bacterium]|nr:hypothetical protein [Clostridia bacterium]
MKQINNHTANAVGKIHGLTLSAFLIVNIVVTAVLQGELFPFLQDFLGTTWLAVIGSIIDATLYGGLYALIKWLCDKSFLRKNKKFDIAGRWYHVHIPRQLGEVDYSAKYLSAGYTDISRELYDFTLNGYNKHMKMFDDGVFPSDDYTTHWYTKATKFADSNEFDLIEIYEAESKGRSVRELKSCPCCKTQFPTPVNISDSENYRYGIHTFKLFTKGVSGVCERIEAEYSDCWPSLKNGDIFFFRTEAERNEYIKNYFRIAQEKNSACS